MCDKDTDSERTATEDNALEITAVYGTQIVSIKKEAEMEIVIKEEGPAIDVADEEMYSDEPIMKTHEITDIPLVYTTKLDYMNTFNNIGRYTSQEATEMIVEESKPHYKSMEKPQELERKESDICINSYIKLCSQIQQLNTKIKTETQLRNQILLDKCKPLQIVLKDFKKSKSTSRPNTLLDYNYSSDDYGISRSPSSYSSDDDEPILNLIPKTSIIAIDHTATLATCSVSIIVAVKDKRCQEADIYILDAKKGVKSYYRANIKECNALEKLHHSKNTILIEYCCWVNREKRISRLIQLGFTRQSLFYLRKPHNCLPRPCSCCCVFGNPILSKVKSNLISKTSEIIAKNMVSAPLNVNNVINKAKNYIPNVPDPPRNITKNDNYLDWAVIIIKYHRVIFKQTHIFGDNYEIGRHGALFNFMRLAVNRSIPEEKQLYEERDKWLTNSMKYFSFRVCCWHNREAIIMRLGEVNNISPDVSKFMKTPHPCRSYKCVCCCKPHTCTNINLDEISTFQKSYTKQKKAPALKIVTEKRKTNIISNKCKPSIRSSLDKSVDIQSEKLKKTNNSRNKRITNKTKAPVGLRKQSREQSNNNLSIAITTDSKTVKHKQTESIFREILSLADKPDTASARSLTTLIDSIFDKYDRLILTVNEKGNLTAIIYATPGSLSKEDSKVMSDMLLLASSRIERLGISLQEFCNRVNFCRNTLTLIAKPVPIITLKEAKRTLEDDTPKNPHLCKVQPLSPNSCIPTTSNTSNVCSIYQVMSSLGGQKNLNLVEGYKLYFKNIQQRDNNRQINKQPSKQETKKKMCERKEINREDKQTISTNEAFIVAKRKATKNTNRNFKKLRVKPPHELLIENPLQTAKLWIGNDNAVTIQKAVNVPHNKAITGHNPAPLIVSDSKFIQLQNTVGTEPAQIQVPTVTNNNLIPVQNLSGKKITQCEIRNINNKMPLFLTTSGTDVPVGSLPGNVASTFLLADTINTVVPPTMHNDKPPVDLSEVIDISEDSCGSDNHVTECDTETPLVRSHSNQMPNTMQNIINAVVDSEATKPKDQIPSVNPLLYKILTQARASPTQSPATPTPSISRQQILGEKAQLNQENSRKEPNKTFRHTNKHKRQDDPDMEMDFESSIQTTVIQNVKFTNEEILDAVNNKQLIANDEEEGIFGA